ncbi:MAG: glycoside hydrolase family 28 protein [Rikenellaceae bacterium]|jgi:polygalacturonase|nr:glycoside hydrolase family 28 protein [Rikenellaceae bacterium]
MKRIILLYATLFLAFQANAEWFDVTKRGARADGQTLVTDVIQKALDEASAAGGGTVYFPAGTYLTGAIHMRSNTTLHLDAGAVLKFSDNPDHYLPFVELRWEGTVMKSFSPLIHAHEVDNIAIEGRGLLDGQGQNWWKAEYDVRGKFAETEAQDSVNPYQQMWVDANPGFTVSDYYRGTIRRKFFRPPFFQAYRSTNIRITGVKFINSPFWTINPAFCRNITIDGVTIENRPSPNTDGINPTSCKDVHIANCHITVGDDCITLKSGRDADGRRWNVPCENITITNCTMLSGHGGVVIGSEISGSVRKVTIANCVFDGTDRGIRLKASRERGGTVEEIRVSNVVMKNIKNMAFEFNLLYDRNIPEGPVNEKTPTFRNIHIAGVTASEVNRAGEITGISEMPVQNLSFSNINMTARTGFNITTARQIEFHDVTVDAETGPSFNVRDAENLVFDNVKTNTPLPGTPTVSLENVRTAYLYNCFPFVMPDVFLRAVGDRNTNIVLTNSLPCPVEGNLGSHQ